jgi:hypothetical protein
MFSCLTATAVLPLACCSACCVPCAGPPQAAWPADLPALPVLQVLEAGTRKVGWAQASYLPFLALLDAEELALITIQSGWTLLCTAVVADVVADVELSAEQVQPAVQRVEWLAKPAVCRGGGGTEDHTELLP